MHQKIYHKQMDFKYFLRGCYKRETCSEARESLLSSCQNAKDAGIDTDCDVNCCNDDLCNAGAAPVVSVLLALSCALFAIFR